MDHHTETEVRDAHDVPHERPGEPKQSTFAKIWAKTGLDPVTLILMAKGGLPPIICLAAYQSTPWAAKYTTLGYLAAIMSLLSLAIQPRAKFIQSMSISIVFVCFGAALALLQIQCVVSARQRTTTHVGTNAVGSSGASQSSEYNSSASVVAAVFLFASIYLASVLRAKRPQLMLPVIQYSIFTIVASTYAPQFPNMAAGMSFVDRLFQTFLTGFGIATGVSLFIVPATSRNISEKQITACLGLMKASILAHGRYMRSTTTYVDGQHVSTAANGGTQKDDGKGKDGSPKTYSEAMSAEAKAMKALLQKMAELFGKIKLEISFARKEFAYGYFQSHDYTDMFDHLREILLPIVGVGTFIDISQTVKRVQRNQVSNVDSDEILEAIKNLKSEEWDEVITMSRAQYEKLRDGMLGGLTHIGLALGLEKRPKAAPYDTEKATQPHPGDPKFTASLEAAIQEFKCHREQVVQRWCNRKGIELPSSFWDDPDKHYSLKDLTSSPEIVRQRANQQQLYLILYIEYMIWCIGKAILKMAQYADSKVEEGTFKKRKIIMPAWHQIRQLWESAFDRSEDTDAFMDGENAGANVWVGDSLKKSKKDPEHLPPNNVYQRMTNHLRLIAKHFASDEASFGFRSAVATLSIGVIAYIQETYGFFLRERVLWAMIMVAISMTPQAGQGVFGFVARVAGTAVAMAASIVIWYMGGQKTAAILPLFYIYICLGFWLIIKQPKFAIVGILSVVTGILIIGYELQVRKIGIKLATSNGQPYYAIYILAPYRLATVIAGIAVCFVWTYFPYPVTTHTTLRKDLGSTLYILANYYSCVHTTVQMQLRLGVVADPKDHTSPLARLEKARHKVFGKCILMLNRLREHSAFTKFEPTFGGQFPKQTYDELIQHMQNIFNYMSMISYASNTFVNETDSDESAWLKDFRKFMSDLNITSQEMTSTLCLTSASMVNRQPLPPYLSVPKPYGIADRMESIDPQLLSVKHVAEPCYAAFAVLEVAASLVTEEMAYVVKKVQDLVGEVDFSFHVISTGDDSSSTLINNDHDESEKAKMA